MSLNFCPCNSLVGTRYVAPRHNLELTLEVILDHKLVIKTMTLLVFSPGSCSESLSLPRNQYRRESKIYSWIVQGQDHNSLGVVQGQYHDLITHLAFLHF
jgi:hypothetical protein